MFELCDKWADCQCCGQPMVYRAALSDGGNPPGGVAALDAGQPIGVWQPPLWQFNLVDLNIYSLAKFVCSGLKVRTQTGFLGERS